jgi:hypothetical protein
MWNMQLGNTLIRDVVCSGNDMHVLTDTFRVHRLTTTGEVKSSYDLLAMFPDWNKTFDPAGGHRVAGAQGDVNLHRTLLWDVEYSVPRVNRVLACLDFESLAPQNCQIFDPWAQLNKKILSSGAEWLPDGSIAVAAHVGLVRIDRESLAVLSSTPYESRENELPIANDTLVFDHKRGLVACAFGEFWVPTTRLYRYRLEASGLVLEKLREFTFPDFTGDLSRLALRGETLLGSIEYYEEKRADRWAAQGRPKSLPCGSVFRLGLSGPPDELDIPDSSQFQPVQVTPVLKIPRMVFPPDQTLRLAALSDSVAVVGSWDGKAYLADFTTRSVRLLDTPLTAPVRCIRFFDGKGLFLGSASGEVCFLSVADLGVG